MDHPEESLGFSMLRNRNLGQWEYSLENLFSEKKNRCHLINANMFGFLSKTYLHQSDDNDFLTHQEEPKKQSTVPLSPFDNFPSNSR
ncbi:hypothetical protein ACH3XW_4485 [Acanthocheilonema viteae]